MNTVASNPIPWVEIPVTNMERAIKFYEAVLGLTLSRHQVGPLDMAWFPMHEKGPGATGALVLHKEWYKPSSFEGALVYFTATSGDVDVELTRVEKAGGSIAQGKKGIGEHGHVGFFIDSEGNRIGLHSSVRI